MREQLGVIFDLDGTLYKMQSADGTFGGSDFYAALKHRMHVFLSERLAIDEAEASALYTNLKQAYNGAVSLGVERELGISRYEWFESTWNLNPADYIQPGATNLAQALAPFEGRSIVLTSGPAAWAKPALAYIGLGSFFGERIITGEQDIRKPQHAVFEQAASMLGCDAAHVVSVGDQDATDIIPARELGMLTVRIGSIIGNAHVRADHVADAVIAISHIEEGIEKDPRRIVV